MELAIGIGIVALGIAVIGTALALPLLLENDPAKAIAAFRTMEKIR